MHICILEYTILFTQIWKERHEFMPFLQTLTDSKTKKIHREFEFDILILCNDNCFRTCASVGIRVGICGCMCKLMCICFLCVFEWFCLFVCALCVAFCAYICVACEFVCPCISVYFCVCLCEWLHACLSVCVSMCEWYNLPTPPLGQDMTQGQFLSGV